ncbi:hypothetical protein BDW69DRAFT_158161 [Aspergillus filifer]
MFTFLLSTINVPANVTLCRATLIQHTMERIIDDYIYSFQLHLVYPLPWWTILLVTLYILSTSKLYWHDGLKLNASSASHESQTLKENLASHI